MRREWENLHNNHSKSVLARLHQNNEVKTVASGHGVVVGWIFVLWSCAIEGIGWKGSVKENWLNSDWPTNTISWWLHSEEHTTLNQLSLNSLYMAFCRPQEQVKFIQQFLHLGLRRLENWAKMQIDLNKGRKISDSPRKAREFVPCLLWLFFPFDGIRKNWSHQSTSIELPLTIMTFSVITRSWNVLTHYFGWAHWRRCKQVVKSSFPPGERLKVDKCRTTLLWNSISIFIQ